MTEPLYYSKHISVTKEFLINTHAHPLLAEIKGLAVDDELYLKMWRNTPDPCTISFGGVFGAQFNSEDQMDSFDEAFNSILAKHKIGYNHKDRLLYFIMFYGNDTEQKSLNNNASNRLLEYTKFILDLHRNCNSHFEAMEKNGDYQLIFDDTCKEYFFARKTLLAKHSISEIAEERIAYSPDDIVSYIRVAVFESELYVPYDLLFSITSDRVLRDFTGKQQGKLILPLYLQSELFKYSLKFMLDAHQHDNTPFYRDISKPGMIASDFKKLYNKYIKRTISQTESLLRVAFVVSDYLNENNLVNNKVAAAAFLFDYLSLFKIIPLKTKETPPSDYLELSKFYARHGVTKHTIRLMMKDALQVGEI